ncbi:TPA: helix-turn-helix domain-containing protein [Morganella morganii subsp. morganii]|uniref:SOS-response transcriptional repressors (RecA-mediated autopeptidases) n=1 Tax=Morganella morganii subsp. morganii KT TaxID=1124991 RepID=M1SXJ8_MORMO|nr:S24 family peptidase [Morganella morganii]AGG31727.1 SOS-response transcriptional repressors (RecA-mediated autopeptidases) [Morganella morganii subsp. morganii KT]HCQ8179977.1 helix-turn-helix domain-containing protein [Morganella morganii]HDT0713786.1 helix-turn-helix domain-containing protein [Morganella morganii subsp. morganii]HDT4951660.1 helix-turn-helix domain-containing protein [Morganella morganii subsp. morganii]
MKTEMNERIKARRTQLNMTQQSLAKMLGVSRVSVTKWETGVTKPDGENLHMLAKSLDVSPEWLLFGGNEPLSTELVSARKTIAVKQIPVISAVQAGDWTSTYASATIDDVLRWVNTTARVSESAFGLDVKGDSMTNPNGSPTIPEGSTVIVETQFGSIEDLYGKIVVAILDGTSDATIKKLVWDAPYTYLIPLNPNFKPIVVNGNCRIIGRVIQVIQNI